MNRDDWGRPLIPPKTFCREHVCGDFALPVWEEWVSDAPKPQSQSQGSHSQAGQKDMSDLQGKDGCPGWDRTSDILINSQTFYR